MAQKLHAESAVCLQKSNGAIAPFLAARLTYYVSSSVEHRAWVLGTCALSGPTRPAVKLASLVRLASGPSCPLPARLACARTGGTDIYRAGARPFPVRVDQYALGAFPRVTAALGVTSLLLLCAASVRRHRGGHGRNLPRWHLREPRASPGNARGMATTEAPQALRAISHRGYRKRLMRTILDLSRERRHRLAPALVSAFETDVPEAETMRAPPPTSS